MEGAPPTIFCTVSRAPTPLPLAHRGGGEPRRTCCEGAPPLTTTLFLVRHGSHDRLGHVMCGRMDGVGLGEAGRAEVVRTAERLGGEAICALYSSPLQRTRETAGIIGERLALPVEIAPGLNELDFGDWTGRPLEELHRDPGWEPWNARRSLHRPPGGESMGEAQMRAVRAVQAICAAHPEQAVAAVSHSDIIKCLLMHYLGLNLDFFHRFEVDPASVSTLVVGDWGAKVLTINLGINQGAGPA